MERPQPRFVPTLTQVVDPSSLVVGVNLQAQAVRQTDRSPDAFGGQEAVLQMQRQIAELIEHEIDSARGEVLLAVHRAVTESLDNLRRTLQVEVEAKIQQALMQLSLNNEKAKFPDV